MCVGRQMDKENEKEEFGIRRFGDDGRVVKRYEPTEKISDIETDIKREMNGKT